MSPEQVTAARREIQDLADRRYQGRTERAFVDWALRCLLADANLEEADFTSMSAFDGSGDLGIDGIRLDDANNRLIFVQGKFTDRVARGQVQEFRQAVESLRDSDYVQEHGNASIKEIYPEVFEPLIDEDFSVYAVVACGGQIAPAAGTWAGRDGSAPWIFEFGEATRRKDFQLQVLDLEGLMSIRRMLTAATAPSPVVTLHLAETPAGVCMHAIGGEVRTTQATVPATDIADAYAKYRSGIFRYNPRGPQGSNKINKEIAETLRERHMKRNFHLLNNGITVVCDSFTYDENEHTVEVKDFQIVNGCQTAFTLHAERAQVTPDVLVGIRLMEGENWAPIIAKTTNSQTSVRPEQLASLGSEHTRIRKEFDQLDAPWFYEHQQGALRFQSPIERQVHRARYADRIVTIKELGQFGAAFVGHPILAKYDLKALFERSDATGLRLYSVIFGTELDADQLLLPVLVGRRVQAHVKDRMATLDRERQQAGIDHDQEGFSEVDWLPYARMHLVALIGEVLRTRNANAARLSKPLTGFESRMRRASIDDWFPEAFEIAKDGVEYRIDVAREADQLTNLREFFRSEEILGRMVDRVKERARRT